MTKSGTWQSWITAFAVITLMSMPAMVPAVSAATPVTITMKTSVHGEILDLTILAHFPISVQLSVKNPAAGANLFWDFGDGQNSTNPAPSHTYFSPFVYDIILHMSSPNGTQSSGKVRFAVMDAKGQNGSIAVYPPVGTYGFIPVKIGGAFFQPGSNVALYMNGSLLANAHADNGGVWVYDVTNALPAGPNGTKYVFTTVLASLVRTFTTVEGIQATPNVGSPGDSVLVQGRSYPASSTVRVYLGGVDLGPAETDETGSFLAGLALPASVSLASGGKYTFETLPPVLGTGASFTISGFGIGGGLQNWWWLILVVAGGLMIYFFVIRPARRRQRISGPTPAT